MIMGLDVNVRACATLHGESWEAVRSCSVILTYGCMACDSMGQVEKSDILLPAKLMKWRCVSWFLASKDEAARTHLTCLVMTWPARVMIEAWEPSHLSLQKPPLVYTIQVP